MVIRTAPSTAGRQRGEPSRKHAVPGKSVVALALGYALLLWCALWAFTHAMPRLDPAGRPVFPDVDELVALLAGRWMAWPEASAGLVLLLAFAAFLVLFGVLGLLLTWVLRRLGIAELHRTTAANLHWALRRSLRLRVFWVFVALVAACIIAHALGATAVLSMLYLAATLLFLAMPAMLLRRDELDEAQAARAPGRASRGQALAIYYLGSAVFLGLASVAASLLVQPGPPGYLVSTLLGVAHSLAGLLLAGMLVDGVGWQTLAVELRQRLSWRLLALSLLLDLRLLLVALWLVPVLLLVVSVSVHVLPTYEATLRAMQLTPGPWYRIMLATLNWVAGYWWLAITVTSVPMLLWYGRSLCALDAPER